MGTIDRTRNTALVALPLLVLASFIVYGRTLDYTAFSDDHSALWNAGVNGIPWRNGFFRPLSDLSFRLGYLLHGSEAYYNRCFNLVLHGVNAYVLFRLVWGQRIDRSFAASLSALLFICYPFHQESVIWLVGRESAVGTFAVLAGLYLLFRTAHPARSWIAGVLLFFGLLSYESAILLPLMAIPFITSSERRRTLIAFGVVLVGYFLIRTLAVGWSGESYLTTVINDPLEILFNIPKVFLRMFLPSSPDPHGMLYKGLGLIAVITVIGIWQFRSSKRDGASAFSLKWWVWLSIALLLPILAAVSTRTSESDRFLYMPSAFLCAIVGLILAQIPQRLVRLGISALILLGALTFVRAGQANWEFASQQTKKLLVELPLVAPETRAFLLDIPDSYQGAFIFRNGLTEAIHLYGKDGTQYINTDPSNIHLDERSYVRFRGQDLPLDVRDQWYRWTGDTFQRIVGPDPKNQ